MRKGGWRVGWGGCRKPLLWFLLHFQLRKFGGTWSVEAEKRQYHCSDHTPPTPLDYSVNSKIRCLKCSLLLAVLPVFSRRATALTLHRLVQRFSDIITLQLVLIGQCRLDEQALFMGGGGAVYSGK